MPDLRLQSPSVQDWRAMAAAASDPQAQRWLGWTDQFLQQARMWTALLDMKPGQGRRLPSTLDGTQMRLAVIDPSERLAGSVDCNTGTGEVGGSLAPQFRGRGLGAALFGGAAEFAHHHLGIASILAGTDPGNVACIGALTAAGFVPTTGPGTHMLPNGRVVFSRWFRHDSEQPARCAAAPRRLRATGTLSEDFLAAEISRPRTQAEKGTRLDAGCPPQSGANERRQLTLKSSA
jgi:RimJ/RimL family protein N-acetyltransferase